MGRSGRHGLVGAVVGLGAGIAAAVLLAPKRRQAAASSVAANAADTVLDVARGVMGCAQSLWRGVKAENASGLLPDERVTLRVRSELERQGIWAAGLNVTTIDGEVYVRGREAEPARAETILRAVRQVPGVVEVVDEIRRE